MLRRSSASVAGEAQNEGRPVSETGNHLFVWCSTNHIACDPVVSPTSKYARIRPRDRCEEERGARHPGTFVDFTETWALASER